ncbi:helix-turn-helix domain-containing protein [Actinoplanes sp. LDG1-06]|uniref:Helix-turn-helix domain-containing protein n=1 Tax=Paractinoplanes ovalisporus TaxID=2810368 RepID=A0ABS2AHH9_9ACTN|nr:helix-turn-helix domain-containing protein [Actinoplanes ovalisporus]MBM2619304.1 helix-turn-helix domain-containing protein [Actinoplanes ovalisporus]
MNRAALGEFLRTRRERTRPSDPGRRRTPGLRRSEVAERAHISEIHYANIEQARGTQPSADVLAAIARALHLDAGETQHLFDLAAQAPPRPAEPDMRLGERTRRLIQSLDPVPVLVLSARLDVIGQNRAAADLLEDFAATTPDRRNLARRRFRPEVPGDVWGAAGLDALSRFAAARLRSASARYPHDPVTRDLVDELRVHSPEFARVWAEEPVGFLRATMLDVTEVRIGAQPHTCEVTDIPERDQHLVFLPAV